MSTPTPQKELVLILARDLASKLATPAFLVDRRGDIVYYNEAAEQILGRPFVEARGMAAKEWAAEFHPVDDEGLSIPLTELPLGITLLERAPAHRAFHIKGVDGVERAIEVTAFPLYAHADEFVGGLAVFWERSEG